MTPTVRVDVTRAMRKLANAGKRVKKTLPQVLEDGARLVAISLAKSSVPYGTGGLAKRQGEKATERDIRKVYRTGRDMYQSLMEKGLFREAAGFWKAFAARQFARAQSILDKTGLAIPIGSFNPSLHKAARHSKTGRVKTKRPLLVVTNPVALNSYIKSKVALVGFGKSGWANVARILGGIRGLRAANLPGGERDITANWITRQKGPGSVVKQYSNPSKPFIIMRNMVRYAEQILSRSARTEAIRLAHVRMAKQAGIVAKYEARQALNSQR